jgi:SAM-dependent methyltransferase
MSHTDWEARYQSGDMPWEKGAPSPGLVDFLSAHRELTGKTVCVPGCGTGHDVREWVKAGFETFGFDIAPSAIALAQGTPVSDPARLKTTRQHAGSETGVPMRLEFRLGDFLRDEPPFLFDWIFEHTLYCAVDPGERELYVQAARRWLKPGGQYLAVNYLIPDQDGPPFGTTREEVVERFAPHFELLSEWMPRSYPNRTGLERMFWWRKK